MDQLNYDLSAKGGGGLRQMHNYVKINENVNIATPPDTFEPDNVNIPDKICIETEKEQRDMDIPKFYKKNL